SVTYSLPPLRLKERGAAGILISSLAQWSLPILIAFAALETGTSLERWMFILATTASGVTLELAHQRHDLPDDAQTGTLTLAARLGQSQVDKLYSCTLWLDRAAIGAIVSAVIIGPPPLIFKDHFFGLLAGLPLLFVYLAALWDT